MLLDGVGIQVAISIGMCSDLIDEGSGVFGEEPVRRNPFLGVRREGKSLQPSGNQGGAVRARFCAQQATELLTTCRLQRSGECLGLFQIPIAHGDGEPPLDHAQSFR